jgi:hypothetical protein
MQCFTAKAISDFVFFHLKCELRKIMSEGAVSKMVVDPNSDAYRLYYAQSICSLTLEMEVYMYVSIENLITLMLHAAVHVQLRADSRLRLISFPPFYDKKWVRHPQN